MKLNTTSYCHKTIRKLCLQLQLLSGTELLTNLDEEFNEIRFINKVGYIIIDYNNQVCFTLSHKIDHIEWQTIKDIILYCNWLEIGREYQERNKSTAK